MAQRRRPRRVAPFIVGGGAIAALVFGLTVMAHGVTVIPSNFFTVLDQQGANDVPGQVDLTQMGRDDSATSSYKLFWSWDSIDQWTGTGQTGDACALFDSDGDTNINFVVCARVSNFNADPTDVRLVQLDATHPVYLFNCGDKKNDRCTTPSPVTYTSPAGADAGVIGTLAKANLISETDPFTTGTSYVHDTTVEVDILKSVLPAGAVLTNVCSYPSAGNGGNNNPFDCIVSPGGGFLVITKVAGTTTQQFTFATTDTPQTSYTVTGSASTGAIGALVTKTPSITEQSVANWSLESITCTKQGGASTGAVDLPNRKVTGIVIESGKTTTCEFTNAPVSPKLTVTKTVVNDNGGTKVVADFPLMVGATGVTSDVQSSFDPGTYTVSETSAAGYTAGAWGGDCADDGSITLNLGDVKSCTITNDDQPGTLIVKKVVVNDNGGTKTAAAFSFLVDGGSATSFEGDGQNDVTVDAGTYSVTEPSVSGYTTTYENCSNVAVATGDTATCTITNDDQAATLIVKKVVVNNSGGTKTAADFSFSVDGGSATSFDADGQNDVTVDAGTYTVTEPSVSGYAATYDNCTNLVIANGASGTCTITNTDQAATLIVKKVVVNDNGGTKSASDFSFDVNGDGAVSFQADGQNDLTVDAGTYSVTEPSVTGYTTTYDNCSDVAVANGGTATCTITNDDDPGTLIVKKVVVNNNGGTKTADDFSFEVDGGTATSFDADGQNDLTVDAGTYSVTEPSVTGYTTTYNNCANVTVANGGSATCTITNNDQAATLKVIKHVINDNGGDLEAGDFTINVTGGNVSDSSFPGAESLGTTITLDAGAYSVDESLVAGYAKTIGADCSGTIANGETKTCTITNDDTKAQPGGVTEQRWVLHDSAYLLGVRHGTGQGTASVTFRLYSDPACTTQVGFETIGSVQADADDIIATVNGILVTDPGTYYWRLFYSGNTFNEPYESLCGFETTTISALEDGPPSGP